MDGMTLDEQDRVVVWKDLRQDDPERRPRYVREPTIPLSELRALVDRWRERSPRPYAEWRTKQQGYNEAASDLEVLIVQHET